MTNERNVVDGVGEIMMRCRCSSVATKPQHGLGREEGLFADDDRLADDLRRRRRRPHRRSTSASAGPSPRSASTPARSRHDPAAADSSSITGRSAAGPRATAAGERPCREAADPGRPERADEGELGADALGDVAVLEQEALVDLEEPGQQLQQRGIRLRHPSPESMYVHLARERDPPRASTYSSIAENGTGVAALGLLEVEQQVETASELCHVEGAALRFPCPHASRPPPDTREPPPGARVSVRGAPPRT